MNSMLRFLPFLLSLATTAVAQVTIPGLTPCGPADCNNQGTCYGYTFFPICICNDNSSFTGLTCNQPKCTSAAQCSNAGTCYGSTASYICVCQFGYYGLNCEQTFLPPTEPPGTATSLSPLQALLTPCTVEDCGPNASSCIGVKALPLCVCQPNFIGSQCQTSLSG